MHTYRGLVVLAVTLVASMVLWHCTNNNATPPDDTCTGPNCEERRIACDPDGRAPCPDDYFYCENDIYGNKRCEGQNEAVPDEGDWDCLEQGGIIECEGDHVPDGEDWSCVEMDDGTVVCRRHSYYPEGGTDGYWDCYFDGEFRICTFRENGSNTDGDADSDADADYDEGGGDDCPPGVEIPTDEWCGDGIDNNCDGRVDEGCLEDDSSCVCIAGAERYCDTPDYCLWGRQVCDDDGLAWGPCIEITDIPTVCAAIDDWYSPRAADCCRTSGFCCQDMWDYDRDGDTWESMGNCVDITTCVDE